MVCVLCAGGALVGVLDGGGACWTTGWRLSGRCEGVGVVCVCFELLTGLLFHLGDLQAVDAVPVCPRPKFVVDDDKVIVLDVDPDQFVVNTRMVQQQPAKTRARIAQADLERVSAAAGTTADNVRARTVQYLGGVAV